MDKMNHAREPVADETIEIEADSVEEAQKQAPEGYRFVIEKILADGRAQSVQGSGDTVKAAFAQAQSSLPEGAQIMAEKEVRPPGRRSCTLEARDEKRARSVAGRQLGETESIGRISLKVAGRKAFLGLIRLPDLYEVEVVQPAVVEVTFKTRARVRVRKRKLPPAAELIDRLKDLTGLLQKCKALPSVRGPSGTPFPDPRVFVILERISDSYNLMLGDAQHLYPGDLAIQKLPLLELGPPKSLALDEIYSDTRQIGQAETALSRLIDLLSARR